MNARQIGTVFLAGLTLGLAGPLTAAVTEEVFLDPWGDPVKERGEKQTMLDERAYKRLTQVQDDLSENDFPSAQKKLNELAKMNLNPYEEALVQQAYGYYYAQQENFKDAIKAFAKVVELDALPDDPQQNSILTLASLYASDEQWQNAIDAMTRWFQHQKKPRADSYILMASAYFQIEQYDDSLKFVKLAIDSADKPTESWYQLELSAYLQKKDYPAVINQLRKMIVLWPNKRDYWETLSGIYQEMEDDVNALSTLMLAYRHGMLDDEKKILNLFRYNMFMESPYTAASVLSLEMAAGRVEKNKKNLEMLLNAWTRAKEFDKAIATIDLIAPMTADGEFYLRKAQLLQERAKWEPTIEAAETAIERGVKKPGGAYLLIGIAYTELKKYRDALRAFEEAMNYDPVTKRQAKDWIAFVKDRMQVAVAAR